MKIGYAGSLISKNNGEYWKHGFLIWNIETQIVEKIILNNERRYRRILAKMNKNKDGIELYDKEEIDKGIYKTINGKDIGEKERTTVEIETMDEQEYERVEKCLQNKYKHHKHIKFTRKYEKK